MAGKPPTTPVDDCDKDFILTLRKIMLRDDFLKAKNSKRKMAFLKYYDEALTSLELRTSLDIMSKEGLQMLEPQQKIQPLPPPQPPMPPMSPQMPGMPPGSPPPNGMLPGAPQPQPAPPPELAPQPQVPQPQGAGQPVLPGLNLPQQM